MNTFKTSSELKSKAKGQLLGKYGTVIPAFLVVESIVFFIQFLASSMIDMNTLYGMIIYYAVAFIMQLIAAIFALGAARLYLNITCNRPYSVNDVFYGFKQYPDKAVKIQLVLLIKESLCLVPAFLLYLIYTYTQFTIIVLLISITGIIGGISACIIALTYSQVYYLILDFPHYSVKEIMAISKTLTKGYRGKLFYLAVSFIPLLLLSLFTCCIGYLWVVPYINATNVQFYLELIRVKSAPSYAAAPAENVQTSIDITV